MTALILPPRLNGFAVDYMPDPDTGEVAVAVWRDDRRDEGILVHCQNWDEVCRLIGHVQAVGRART